MSKRKKHEWIDGIECRWCNKCKTYLPLNDFGKNRKRWDGLQDRCKSCRKQDHLDNFNRDNQRLKKWQHNNPGYMEVWRANNIEHEKEYSKQYKIINSTRVYAWNAKRRAMRLDALSPDADKKKIQAYYDLRDEMSVNGMVYHVDHIQPLTKGGLEHEDNLQVLEASLNLKKSDTWPLSPEEKIKYKGFRI